MTKECEQVAVAEFLAGVGRVGGPGVLTSCSEKVEGLKAEMENQNFFLRLSHCLGT